MDPVLATLFAISDREQNPTDSKSSKSNLFQIFRQKPWCDDKRTKGRKSRDTILEGTNKNTGIELMVPVPICRYCQLNPVVEES